MDFLGGAVFVAAAVAIVVELDTFARGLLSETPNTVDCGIAALGCPLVGAGLCFVLVASIPPEGRSTSFSTSCSTMPSDPCPAACCPSTLTCSTGQSNRFGRSPSGLFSFSSSFPLTLALLLSPVRTVLLDRGRTSTVTCLFTTIPLRLVLPLVLLGEFPPVPSSTS